MPANVTWAIAPMLGKCHKKACLKSFKQFKSSLHHWQIISIAIYKKLSGVCECSSEEEKRYCQNECWGCAYATAYVWSFGLLWGQFSSSTSTGVLGTELRTPGCRGKASLPAEPFCWLWTEILILWNLVFMKLSIKIRSYVWPPSQSQVTLLATITYTVFFSSTVSFMTIKKSCDIYT